MIYVALDLGSESMAAYYSDIFGNGGMIKLQADAALLLQNGSGSDIEYLLDELNDGTRTHSPRLRNRISFRDQVQPRNLPLGHASLQFLEPGNNRYEQSIFRFFHRIGEWPPEKVMPNPKILFQHQIKDILPKVEAEGGGYINLSPEELVKHLSLQVLINFVLNSRELRDTSRDEIHLTITVPNVYSLPHAQSIREFVNASHIVREVDILSESDAVAYYVLSAVDSKDPDELKSFKQELQESLTKRKKLCLITIDIGKGTTDLSCILKEEPKDVNARSSGFLSELLGKRAESDETVKIDKQKHSVQGKTGKSSGGNYLNYIFAKYYDQRLANAAEKIREVTGTGVPFGFLKRPNNASLHTAQNHAIFELEKLIEQIKRHVTEDYQIDDKIFKPDQQQDLLNAVVDYMLEGIDVNWRNNRDQYDAFRQEVVNTLFLPRKLERHLLVRILSRSEPLPTEILKQKLEEYVKENVDEMLESLKSLVKEHRGEIDKNTFVVVSGQASQFRPIRRAIAQKCDELSINGQHRYLMKGLDSKEACCKGVINFRRDNMLHVNPKALHGTYGCLAVGLRPKPDDFKPFNMTELRTKGRTKIGFSAPTTYYVIFTPRSYQEVLQSPPKKNDGATALIDVFENAKEFEIEYDRDRLELIVYTNANPTGKMLELKTFGSVDGSIYPKVWPEILNTESE